MGATKELFELGLKTIKTPIKNFIDNGLSKIDGKSLVHMYKTDTPRFEKLYSDMDSFTKTNDENAAVSIIKSVEDYTAQRQQSAMSEQVQALTYTRPDAMQNLQQAGLNPPKGGGLYGRKTTPRTLQGPVPPSLPDKTLDQGAKSYEEAVMLGTTKFTEDGKVKQIRNYGSDTAPHGRVTNVGVRKTSGRGSYARLQAETLLTLGDDVKGFYQHKLPGHDDAHHWNPIGIMKRVVDGMPKAKRNQFIQEIQDELGLFSGNHIANLRQLSPDVHRWLHRRLEALGYNPASLKSFKGKSVQARKAYFKKFADDLNKLDEELFSEMQISKGNKPGPKLQ